MKCHIRRGFKTSALKEKEKGCRDLCVCVCQILCSSIPIARDLGTIESGDFGEDCLFCQSREARSGLKLCAGGGIDEFTR